MMTGENSSPQGKYLGRAIPGPATIIIFSSKDKYRTKDYLTTL